MASRRNPAAPSSMQVQHLAVSPNNIQGAAGWISQQGSSPVHQFGSPQHHPSPSQMLPSRMPQSQNIQGTTLQMAPQVAAAQMNAHGAKTLLPMVNPGSGGQPVPHASPNMMPMQQFPPKMAGPSGAPSGGLPRGPQSYPALPREQFNAAYQQFRLKQAVQPDLGMLQFESRQISLHMLHAGGAARMSRRVAHYE